MVEEAMPSPHHSVCILRDKALPVVFVLPKTTFCCRWWQTATAKASVASRNWMCSEIGYIRQSIAETCSLEALPLPVIDCLILRGEYSWTSMPACIEAAMTMP